jgi:hypothetical protein
MGKELLTSKCKALLTAKSPLGIQRRNQESEATVK